MNEGRALAGRSALRSASGDFVEKHAARMTLPITVLLNLVSTITA
jgi:hypothetical protein